MALVAIALAAAAIRLVRLDHFSYWLDEILQTYWLNGTWSYFWKSLRFDGFHPPLDYVVGKVVELFYPSDAARKLPAVAWGVATVATLGALVARRAGQAAGLVAAAILAFAPFHVRFSQELRPYSLALFLLCLSLWSLDRFLERPGVPRLIALYLACLATAYAQYLAALVLGIAAAALLVEDAAVPQPDRRKAARRFLAWSPIFVFALWLAYLPWWPVVLDVAHRPAVAARAPLSLERAGRVLSFFAFAPADGYLLGNGGIFFLALLLAGVLIALSRSGLRFLLVWSLGGLVAIEILGQIHPHYDAARRFLPIGPAITALVALPLAALLTKPVARFAGAGLLAAVLYLDLRGLAVYFREGRPDWRPLAKFLRTQASSKDRVFAENQYQQLCVAYYLVGSSWLADASEGRSISPEIYTLDGEPVRLSWAWKPGQRSWLLLLGSNPKAASLRTWAGAFPTFQFSRAENTTLFRLDPNLRDEAFTPQKLQLLKRW